MGSEFHEVLFYAPVVWVKIPQFPYWPARCVKPAYIKKEIKKLEEDLKETDKELEEDLKKKDKKENLKKKDKKEKNKKEEIKDKKEEIKNLKKKIASMKRLLKNKNKKTQVNVQFYGDYTFSRVNIGVIKPYHRFKKEFSKNKDKDKLLQVALDDADIKWGKYCLHCGDEFEDTEEEAASLFMCGDEKHTWGCDGFTHRDCWVHYDPDNDTDFKCNICKFEDEEINEIEEPIPWDENTPYERKNKMTYKETATENKTKQKEATIKSKSSEHLEKKSKDVNKRKRSLKNKGEDEMDEQDYLKDDGSLSAPDKSKKRLKKKSDESEEKMSAPKAKSNEKKDSKVIDSSISDQDKSKKKLKKKKKEKKEKSSAGEARNDEKKDNEIAAAKKTNLNIDKGDIDSKLEQKTSIELKYKEKKLRGADVKLEQKVSTKLKSEKSSGHKAKNDKKKNNEIADAKKADLNVDKGDIDSKLEQKTSIELKHKKKKLRSEDVKIEEKVSTKLKREKSESKPTSVIDIREKDSNSSERKGDGNQKASKSRKMRKRSRSSQLSHDQLVIESGAELKMKKKKRVQDVESVASETTEHSVDLTLLSDFDEVLEKVRTSYLPPSIAENFSEELDQESENKWFLNIAIVGSYMTDNVKELKKRLKDDVLSYKQWTWPKSVWKDHINGEKWHTLVKKSYEILKQEMEGDSTSCRHLRANCNRVLFQLLGYIACKRKIVPTVNDVQRKITDKLWEKVIVLANNKKTFKDKAREAFENLGHDVDLNVVDIENGSEIYSTIREQVCERGAKWPQHKARALSRDNVKFAFAFYEGVKLIHHQVAKLSLADYQKKVKKNELELESTPKKLKDIKENVEKVAGLNSVKEGSNNDTAVKVPCKVETGTPQKKEELNSEVKKETVLKETGENATNTPSANKATAGEDSKSQKQSTKPKTSIVKEEDTEVKVKSKSKIEVEMKKEKHVNAFNPKDEAEKSSWISDKLESTLNRVLSRSFSYPIPGVKRCQRGSKESFDYFGTFLKQENDDDERNVNILQGDGQIVTEPPVPILADEWGVLEPSLPWWGIQDCDLSSCADSDEDMSKHKSSRRKKTQ